MKETNEELDAKILEAKKWKRYSIDESEEHHKTKAAFKAYKAQVHSTDQAREIRKL